MADSPIMYPNAVPPAPNLIPSPGPAPMAPTNVAQASTVWQQMSDDVVRALAPFNQGAAEESKRRAMKGPVENAAKWLMDTTRSGIAGASDETILRMAGSGSSAAVQEAQRRGLPGYRRDTTAGARDMQRHGSVGMGMPPAPLIPQAEAATMPGPTMGGGTTLPAPPSAVPGPPPGDFAGAMQNMVHDFPVARPRPQPPMAPPSTVGGGLMADMPGGQAATAAPTSFSDNPRKMEMLRDFGLRLMAAGDPYPGATVGPSLAGAVGRAGMATFEDRRARDAAAATAEFERTKHADQMRMDERKIQSTEALRKATIEARAEAQQLSNEISAMRAKTDRGTLELQITDKENRAVDKLREDPLLMTDEPALQRAIDNVYALHDRIRVQNGFKPQHAGASAGGAPTATNQATGEKLILRDGKWVPM